MVFSIIEHIKHVLPIAGLAPITTKSQKCSTLYFALQSRVFLQRKKKELEEWFAGQRSYTNLIEIDGFEYDDIKLEFALGNGNKTLNLREISSVVVSEDITDKVMQVGGNPDYDKLKPVMKQTAEEYLKNMGFLNE